MDNFAKHLKDLWNVNVSERHNAIKYLQQICTNILIDSSNPKFRDLDYKEIDKKLNHCQPARLLLFDIGFTLSEDGERLQLDPDELTVIKIRVLQDALKPQNAPISVQLSTICYCNQPLIEYNSSKNLSKYKCRSCWKPLAYSSFDCKNKSCIYKRISGQPYFVCPSCHQQDVHITSDETDEGRKLVFVSKLRSEITATKLRINEFGDENVATNDFVNILVRAATSINPNVEEQSVRDAVRDGSLSWNAVENQRKDFIVGKLRVMAELNETQCNELFEKLDGVIPIAPETERRNRMLQMRRIFYQKWIMKLSPEDVGGEEVLNNLRGDVATALKDALSISMNQQCYCRDPLSRTTWNRPYSDWICRSCFTNQSGRVVFYCFNSNCIFKRITEWNYCICPQCFERRDNDQICDETDEKEDGTEDTFICNQIKRRINMISSDFVYLNV